MFIIWPSLIRKVLFLCWDLKNPKPGSEYSQGEWVLCSVQQPRGTSQSDGFVQRQFLVLKIIHIETIWHPYFKQKTVSLTELLQYVQRQEYETMSSLKFLEHKMVDAMDFHLDTTKLLTTMTILFMFLKMFLLLSIQISKQSHFIFLLLLLIHGILIRLFIFHFSRNSLRDM